MKKIIGITGGISSGKTTVCNAIANKGYKIIDCDKINKDLSKIGMPIYNAIINTFGNDYLLDNNEIDRKKLGSLIFNNNEAKLKLNEITHPLILLEMKRQISLINDKLVFVEIPLLYEAKLDNICDYVICVYLDKKTQLERLIKRESIDEAYALAKINSQMDLDKKRDLADYVINTMGDLEDTINQTEEIINKLEGDN